MKTYKKPYSVVIELDPEDMMQAVGNVSAPTLDGTKYDATTGTQEAGIKEADAKGGFDTWE